MGAKFHSCKWTVSGNIVFSDDSKKVKTYPVDASGNIGAQNSIITASQDFTDVAVKPVAGTAKIVASGGDNSQASSAYFSNSGGTINEVLNTFTTAPTSIMNTACYSGNGNHYAVGGDDRKIWVFNDSSNNIEQELFDGVNTITDCDFSADGEYLLATTGLTSGNAYVYVYKRICYFCSPGFY